MHPDLCKDILYRLYCPYSPSVVVCVLVTGTGGADPLIVLPVPHVGVFVRVLLNALLFVPARRALGGGEGSKGRRHGTGSHGQEEKTVG